MLAQKKKEAKQKDGAKVSLKKVKYYNHDTLALRGDRTVGNFIEQGLYFLPLFWMHALFVDPTESFAIAAFYTASRAIYPLVFGNKISPVLILISTVPGYAVNLYLMVQLGRATA